MYGDEGPQNVRSDVSDQEDDEESEGCPVSISKFKAPHVFMLIPDRLVNEAVGWSVENVELSIKQPNLNSMMILTELPGHAPWFMVLTE